MQGSQTQNNNLTVGTENRTIIIGCDDLSRLSIILNAFRQPAFSNHAFIAVSSGQDLISNAATKSPLLVILSFSQNQLVLNQFCSDFSMKVYPVFCFTQDAYSESVTWPVGFNIFTYPFDRGVEEGSIANRIASVLALLHPLKTIIPSTFVPHYQGQVGVQNLSRYVLELDQKNAILERVKEEVETIAMHASDQVRNELTSLLGIIKQTKADQRYWKDFKQYFNEINPNFFKTLAGRHPSLTPKDLKYCCYLSLNLSNNEITRLMGINQESVRTHKYRLKKKMALSKEQNLEQYLIRVNTNAVKSVG